MGVEEGGRPGRKVKGKKEQRLGAGRHSGMH